MKYKKEYISIIANYLHISETEIAKVFPNYQYSWYEDDKENLSEILYELGMDTTRHWEYQQPVQHRNRLGEVVTSGRYYGIERIDKEYLESGFASPAAKAKSQNSRLMDELWRAKGLTEDCIEAAEWKDKYSEGKE